MTPADHGLPRAAVLAVDGGNSKTEVVLLDRLGNVLGVARGPGSNHAHSDHQTVMRLIDSLVARAASELRPETEAAERTAAIADAAVLCLAGADYVRDERTLAASAAPFGWADPLMVRNDAVAMLRAGTDCEVGIALVCGAGVNCVGNGPGGRTVRFPALGEISGDWGGGYDVGMAALVAAVRAEDGRGPRTLLADLVPRHFDLARPASLVLALHTGRIATDRVIELPPLVFAAADDGDDVARRIVDRLGDELVAMATATLRRLRLTRTDVDVVLGGGILTSGHPRLLGRVTTGIVAVAPRARLLELATPPATGAALLGFDALRVMPVIDVRAAVREALRAEEGR
jgi:N-acetylglucosamine kinase-like BadF-type ATPase